MAPAASEASKVAAGWLALSVRQNSDGTLALPAVPSVRYIRVFPFLTVGANITRSVPPPGLRGANTWWKSYGVDEPSSAAERRQRPWSNADAYTVCGSSGSSAASLTPKVAPLPFQTSVNVAPPSVDS